MDKAFTPLEIRESRGKFKQNKFLTGFTLIELLVVIAIIAILSAIILFSATQYINKGKDASVIGNLVILVPAGEVYYSRNNTYEGFQASSAFTNSWSAILTDKYKGEVKNSWAACAKLADATKAYCVDSRGIKKEINYTSCLNISNTNTACP